MADENRTPADRLAPTREAALQALLARVRAAPHEFGFLQLLRRMQHLAADRPRLGEADRPSDEPVRLGQEPSLSFAPSELAELVPGGDGRAPRLLVHLFGMLGPNGPLPLHITEYARDRLRNYDDPTMTRFLDLFHHRMLMFFFRAWAAGQPAASHDRRADDRFEAYVGALEGLGLQTLRGRDAFPDEAKLFYVGRFAGQTRNADGLADVAGDFFGVPARVDPFIRDWLDLPEPSLWRLGRPTGPGRLGQSTTIGARVATRQQRFQLVLGPLSRETFQRLLPGGDGLRKLTALVRGYAGDELRWDLRLVLREEVDEPWRLGQSRLGWTTWLGRVRTADARGRLSDVVLDPQRGERAESRAAA
ncbi:MAG: type secretion protein family [Myxococcales bacterium]|nr:type secretion protein family [Myxococcales bacterium]